MDEATLARIFDPFFTTKTSGRGLGLSAMLGILRGHGAGLSIQTKVGEGTCFRVYFPVAPPRTRPTTVPPPRSEATQTGTILLVDDEHALRRATRELLEVAGFVVLEAKDGAEAVAIFGEHRRDIALVLLDLVMPQMDGRETLRALHAIDPEARVVLMSGYDAGEVLDGIRGEVAGFLAKPFTPDALTQTVRDAL
jgi:CheY-like chemotaxis protein